MNLASQILFMIFRLIARFRLPRLGAHLLVLTLRPVTMPDGKEGSRKKRYRALVMRRTGFLEDVEQSFLAADDFEGIGWYSGALKAFASEILSPSLDHNNYISSDPKIEATKMRYRRFLSDLWQHFVSIKPIDVVLTGNFAYFTERELAIVLEQAGTPFIALHKENVRPPRRVREYWFTLYKDRRGKFGGRRILVYNEIERELEISAGVIDVDRVSVTGMPRLDRLHRWRLEHVRRGSNNEKPRVLFFAFARSDKLTAIQRKTFAGIPGDMEEMAGEWGKMSWGKFCIDTHKAIVEVARENPDFEVIVKSKGQKRKLNDILQMLSEMRDGLPPNLKIVASGDPFDLIASSRVVIGFNTTGLLEAIATGKPVIVPRFAEASDSAMQDLIIDLGAAVDYADSTDGLKAMISRYVRNPEKPPAQLSEESRDALRYWVGNDDGLAGQRVTEILRAEIESTRSGRLRRTKDL